SAASPPGTLPECEPSSPGLLRASHCGFFLGPSLSPHGSLLMLAHFHHAACRSLRVRWSLAEINAYNAATPEFRKLMVRQKLLELRIGCRCPESTIDRCTHGLG